MLPWLQDCEQLAQNAWDRSLGDRATRHWVQDTIKGRCFLACEWEEGSGDSTSPSVAKEEHRALHQVLMVRTLWLHLHGIFLQRVTDSHTDSGPFQRTPSDCDKHNQHNGGGREGTTHSRSSSSFLHEVFGTMAEEQLLKQHRNGGTNSGAWRCCSGSTVVCCQFRPPV